MYPSGYGYTPPPLDVNEVKHWECIACEGHPHVQAHKAEERGLGHPQAGGQDGRGRVSGVQGGVRRATSPT